MISFAAEMTVGCQRCKLPLFSHHRTAAAWSVSSRVQLHHSHDRKTLRGRGGREDEHLLNT